MSRARLKTPELTAVSRVERKEIPFGIAGEYEVSGGREHRRQQDELVRPAPDALSRRGIPRVHVAVRGAIRREFQGESAVHKVPALIGLVIVRCDVVAQ